MPKKWARGPVSTYTVLPTQVFELEGGPPLVALTRGSSLRPLRVRTTPAYTQCKGT